MKLPPFLFNRASGTALTVEFWATFGANANNTVVYDFGSQGTINGVLEGYGHLSFVAENVLLLHGSPPFSDSVRSNLTCSLDQGIVQ